jgi:hypothetical protein
MQQRQPCAQWLPLLRRASVKRRRRPEESREIHPLHEQACHRAVYILELISHITPHGAVPTMAWGSLRLVALCSVLSVSQALDGMIYSVSLNGTTNMPNLLAVDLKT